MNDNNIAGADSMEASMETTQLVSEIQARIKALESLFEESLTGEMDALKEALVQNPSAAALLKDEDIGLLVANLRRTVASALSDAAESKKKPAKDKAKTRMTKEEIEAALEAEGL